MVGHGGSSAGSYLANPTFPIPSHCASIVVTSTLRVKTQCLLSVCIFADEDEARLTLPATPQLVKCVSNKSTPPPPAVTPCVKDVVEELLNALILKYTAIAPGTFLRSEYTGRGLTNFAHPEKDWAWCKNQ